MPKKNAPEENIVAESTKEAQSIETSDTAAKTQPKKDKVMASTKPAQSARGKKISEALKLVDPNKKYDLAEAINLVKKTSYTKFDGSVELHIKTTLKKGQELLRGLVALPAGSPKQPKILVADENIIDDIKAGKINFDILIATPELMPKLATVAKILGPKGLMPSPKSGTVTPDPKAALEEFKKGKAEYKSDPLGNIHIAVGKISWESSSIEDNIKAILSTITSNRIANISLSATMGPGIRVK
jgi:large subunit ribosomal protein L1